LPVHKERAEFKDAISDCPIEFHTSQVENQLVALQFALEKLPRIEIRIYSRIRHNNILFSSAHRVLLYEASRILYIHEDGGVQVNHLSVESKQDQGHTIGKE
jgi:hypothetical protein